MSIVITSRSKIMKWNLTCMKVKSFERNFIFRFPLSYTCMFSLSVSGEDHIISMEMESCVPPGFRFHPTEEELVGYYLRRKINSLRIDLDVIVEIDLYKMEPWDIQGTLKLQ